MASSPDCQTGFTMATGPISRLFFDGRRTVELRREAVPLGWNLVHCGGQKSFKTDQYLQQKTQALGLDHDVLNPSEEYHKNVIVGAVHVASVRPVRLCKSHPWYDEGLGKQMAFIDKSVLLREPHNLTTKSGIWAVDTDLSMLLQQAETAGPMRTYEAPAAPQPSARAQRAVRQRSKAAVEGLEGDVVVNGEEAMLPGPSSLEEMLQWPMNMLDSLKQITFGLDVLLQNLQVLTAWNSHALLCGWVDWSCIC